MTAPDSSRQPSWTVLLLSLLMLLACRPMSATAEPSTDVFDAFMYSDIAPADGFDFPVGDADAKGYYVDRKTGKDFKGWYIATKFGEKYELGLHPAEDWNGVGGGDTDLGQDVLAIARGRVVVSDQLGQPWGNVVVLEHVFYENNRQLRIRSLYAHLLERSVQVGDVVTRRQRIGAIGKDPDATFTAHLHLEVRWDLSLEPTYWPSSNGRDQAWIQEHYAEPSKFIRAHRHLPTPQTEAALAVIDPVSRRLRLYAEGKARGTYEVSFGQADGQKEKKGDLKTPRGMYFVVDKHRGAISGEYGEYYGGAWIKLNYPNPFDAARGMKEGLVGSSMVDAIREKWFARQLTPQNTALGGGIGLHGWIEEWSNDGPRALSWGCVVMHLSDIPDIFGALPVGAMVVIL